MPDFPIREARRDDVAAIVAMLTDDFLGANRENQSDLAPYLAAFETMDADPNNNLFVVCDENDEPIGTFQLIYMQGLSVGACKRAEVEAVRIASTMRGQGIGKQMFDYAIEKARADGCGMMQLTTNKQRVDGQRFYDRLGFEASHIGYKMKL
ncbi:GNAT family N-acetyltransferase [uncultured Cohaesibacter sp.]|uniref:GNAT family N-acetyltransferase n=1 Tax=uncultured Cohaesibacter sp. TaxID=1002546 RepID=UPI00292CA68A|nr:GNAT family N-acetyltransferase [uncultured Cohaesibacter sp.]